MSVTAYSFVAVLMVFLAIGVSSIRKKHSDVNDYLTAGYSTAPWLIGLSSVATNNSGYMFIGLVGYTWMAGVSAFCVALGWLFGDWLVWCGFHQRLRRYSEAHPVNTIPALTALDPATQSSPLRLVSAVITLVFLAVYAAAQLKAGSKALNVMFSWPEWLGALLGAAVVLLYSFAGGIRASIWTDAAQSFVMLFGMIALFVAGLLAVGWPWELAAALESVDPTLVHWSPDGLLFGLVPFILGWVAAGIGAIGQPHILVRTIALRSPDDVPAARRVYFAWYLPFAVLTVTVGLYARVLLDGELIDPELTLPLMAELYLPEILTGMVLAAIFAATLSTADSMLLSCSAAISQDLIPRFGQSYVRTKVGTLGITVLVLAIALSAPANVFTLVVFAWSSLGGTLGPVILLRIMHAPLGRPTALTMMASGMATLIIWQLLGYSDSLYELLPALAVSFLVYGLMYPFQHKEA
ncbi:sodium/proline symporter PutP [Marinobacter nanhaiticus D15-8W]|uniref:Sodium/proline symporter n=1 Tax=Marinobacter nanhaiticus D15-8W TaxID=626887 RepID=N6WV92_9GAMM|nr:sodium/proline symporter [Marinobacter nanhaiticus]ENO12728.1 sodium/proline symporter [Marinobacter nanhaiticus D15-8W]BES70071.1 sodium/proline symporter PutP [Marinobacter nanhaiticus D15-8W]